MQGSEQNTSSLWTRLTRSFRDREYRHVYAESFTNTLIAAQLKANREMRKLSQEQLAELAGMKQSRISAIENVNYESWSVRTLRRIARTFDLVLVIKFESFGNVVREMESFDRSSLERPSFQDDPDFKVSSERTTTPGNVVAFPGARSQEDSSAGDALAVADFAGEIIGSHNWGITAHG